MDRVQEYNGIIIDYDRDSDIPEQGVALLTGKGFYKKDYEVSPQQTFARAATCFSFGDYELAQRIYDARSKGWFVFASPVQSNAVDVQWPTFREDEFNEAAEWLENNVTPDGMPISCFEGSTPVYTLNGVKSIKDIKVGEKVLTHKGRFRTVEATRESLSEDIYELQCSINRTKLKVTGNHLMLTNMGWVRVDELVKGKHLIAHSNFINKECGVEKIYLRSNYEHKDYYNEGSFKAKDIPSELEIDKELAWALGFWFAEGSSTEIGTLKVTHGTEEPCKKWVDIISEKFSLNGKTRSNKSWFDGEVNSVALTRTFDNLFGKGCKTKCLPESWMEVTWDSEIFEAFLDGFYLGDGFKTTDTSMFELANPKLVSQFAILLMEQGYNVSCQYRKQVKYNKDKGNDVYNAVISYRPKEEISSVGVRNGIPMADGLKYATIDLVEKIESSEIKVYDLQVEEDTSFSVAGLIAHNCFLAAVEDSKESLVETRKEVAWLSMMGGGIGIYAGNRSPDEKSTGVMSHLRGYDADTLSYRQTSSRRGSMAAYMDIDHPEIMSFIGMRNPVGGDQNKKCFNLNNAVNIPDSFMEAVARGEKYELVDPKHGPTGKFLDAREVWETILETRFETGEPYIMYKDTVNRNIPECIKRPLYTVQQSNLCSEITLMTSTKRTAVCCLSSLNLEKYDEWKDTTLVADLTRFLDNVLEYFIRLAPSYLWRAVRSAAKERAIGIGTMGWHSYLQSKDIPFESGGMDSASSLTYQVYKDLYTKGVAESKKLGELRGESPDTKGSGHRGSHLFAIAPNASSSTLVGASPSVELFAANCYVAQGRAGSFIVKNKYLKKILESLGMDKDEVWKDIMENGGSVQHLDFLSDHHKKVFKTATEVDQRWVVELASIRQEFICQAQSINLFVASNITLQEMSDLHFLAWKKGLKTLYYCRAEAATKVNLGTGGDKPLNALPVKAKIEFDTCLSCEG